MFPLGPALSLALALGGPAPPQDSPPSIGIREAVWTDWARLPDVDEWRALLERDGRIDFTPRSAEDARAALAQWSHDPRYRCPALVALGASRDVSSRSELERAIQDGEELEREAAVLALGELGRGVRDRLTQLAADPRPDVAECALVALVRADDRDVLRSIAADPTNPHAASARTVLELDKDPGAAPPHRAATLLLNLRWVAARRFGLVDGRSWKSIRLHQLASDPRFLGPFILRAAARVNRPGVRDHLLEALVAGPDVYPGEGRIQAAVLAMPRELSQMVSKGAWVPADVREWVALIDEIEIQGLEMLTVELLRTALDAPAVRVRAAGLLARAGDSSALHAMFRNTPEGRQGNEPLSNVEKPFEERTVPGKLLLCEVWGGSRDRVFIPLLEQGLEDPDERVRAAALVAQARLGHAPALRTVENVVVGDPTLVPDDAPREAAIVEMLLRTGNDGATIGILERMLPKSEGEKKLRIATLLALKGKLSAREALRSEYGEGSLRDYIGVETVRALGKFASAEDLKLFAELTYQPEDRDLNVELALALFAHGDAVVLPLVDEALWTGPWNESILAGMLMIEYGTMRRLLDEAESPPAAASTADLRRVGFAIGEWGGFDALADLERRLRPRAGDPVVMGAVLGALSTRTQ